jgi:2-polyprenyl-3-methyl-5-hydroxy-6-metoxy-1,4-benzoquinol methylase
MDLEEPLPGQELVQSQWRTIEYLERMTEREARREVAADFRAQYRQALSQLPTLTPWPQLPQRNLRVYRNRENQTRVWRVCQFLSSSDRVLDIGMGHGWMPGNLALAVGPQAYAGVDITDSKFDSVREMAEVNGIDTAGWYLGVKDLYDLTPEWVSEHDPTIVLLLEVLEHLPYPQKALRVIADAVSPETQLLFSVPMLGRVESCWGHVSLFDADRVRKLCANAGFTVHWVEPVANTWQLLLVSRSTTRPSRVARLAKDLQPSPLGAGGDRAGPALQPGGDPAFHRVVIQPSTLEPSVWTQGLAEHQVTRDDRGGVRVGIRTETGLPGSKRYAGVAFPVDGLQVLRLELCVPESRAVSGLIVEGRDGAGRRTARWDFKPGLRRRLPAQDTTFVLRPGRATAGFKSVVADDTSSTRVVEVVAKLRPRSHGSLVVRQAAFVR